jgi:hypothetical protein
MPMTIPGGGGSLKALSDVNVNPGAANDQQRLIYQFATGKWIAQAGGVPIPSVAKISTTDTTAGITLSAGNLTVTTNAVAATYGARGTIGQSSGKLYFEGKFTQFATGGANALAIGLADSAMVLTGAIGSANTDSITYDSNSWNIDYNGANQGTLGAPAANDVICVAVDIGNALAWLRRNAGNWNNNAGANPATGANGVNISSLVAKLPLYPFFQAVSGGTAFIETYNFGATAFAQAVPNGFSPWDTFSVQAQTVGASPVTITAPGNGAMIVNAGTVSSIVFSRDGTNNYTTGQTSGVIPVFKGDTLTITYTVAPTVSFIPA